MHRLDSDLDAELADYGCVVRHTINCEILDFVELALVQERPFFEVDSFQIGMVLVDFADDALACLVVLLFD